MSSQQRQIAQGIQTIKDISPNFARVISNSPKFDLRPKIDLTEATAFESLAHSVFSQQISTSAAKSISTKVSKAFRGSITPRKIAKSDVETLRSLGLSNAKARTIRELAEAVLSKTLELGKLSEMQDAEIVEQLVQVWGIGRWTAEMFLMFDLGRLDVWPAGDFGVRKGWQLIHQDDEMHAQKQFEYLGESFRPYRSIAAWYCWRAVDLSRSTGNAD
jgi:DNA-3-methyladenine glycosylase II